MFSRIRRLLRNKSSENAPSSSDVHPQQARQIKIGGRGSILSVAFLDDGKYIVSAGREGKIRRWRVEDGTEVGMPVDAGNAVRSIALSRDGKWVVSGAQSGSVTVWSAETHEKMTAFKGHSSSVCAVDVSPDGTRIATGSHDFSACVWLRTTGERLLDPLKHNNVVPAVKFSPNGRLVATATTSWQSIRIYDSQDGHFLVDVPIQVPLSQNQCLAWTSDSKQLFVLSHNGNINCFDVSTRTVLAQWSIHSSSDQRCIALANNLTLIAASSGSSVSFWDTMTQRQIGPVIQHTDGVESMAISANYDLVMGGRKTITLRDLCDVLPSSYSDNISAERARRRTEAGNADPKETIKSPRAEEEGPNRETEHIEETLQQLHNKSSDSQRAVSHQEDNSDEAVGSFRAQDSNLDREITRPNQNVEQLLRNRFSDLQHGADNLNGTIEPLRVQEMNSNSKITYLRQELHTQHAYSNGRADSLIQTIDAHEQKNQCEILYAKERTIDAALSLLKITNAISEVVRANRPIMDWLDKFKSQCISTLEMIGDKASSTEKQEEAAEAYSTALLLSQLTSNTLLTKWTSTVLIRSPANGALSAAAECGLPKNVIYRTICDVLERGGRIFGALECLRQMESELGDGTGNRDGQAQPELGGGFQRRHSDAIDSFHETMNVPEKTNSIDDTEWVVNFKVRCLKRLEQDGDIAMDSASYRDAIAHYTIALTLNTSSVDLLTKRSRARAKIGSWKDSLEDANAAIELDSSSPHGYERRHAALFGAHRYDEAIEAYNGMLVKLEQSPDPVTRKLREHYRSPPQMMEAIRNSAEQTQRDVPLVLIHAETGCLCDKRERLIKFEADPKFKELVASATKGLDNSHITQAVHQYFRYATFSHTWEGAEPDFSSVLRESVRGLAESPTVSKLVMFCMMAQKAGLLWAWSDTCCINKTDGSVLQESLTSMFQWYHKSALTIVHLKGVRSDLELGALIKCLWNARAWTLQEFFASRVIRFYTEDWKLYLPHEEVYNHKDSPTIMGEMAAATGVNVQVLLSLHPGSESVRQKLCLAATRIATKQEDIAYSLFGIFDVSIPVTYGEGQQRALGRLLQEVLTRSGDVTILAWTGKASNYNSCLPAEIAVYREPASPHIPSLEDDKMDALVAELRKPPYLDPAVKLYDRVIALPSPRLVSRRLTLSCIMFPLKGQLASSSDPRHVYHAVTSAFGNVEIKTTEDLSGLNNLVLVHPWLRCLLDPVLPFEDLDGDDGDSDAHSTFTSHTVSHQYDKPTRALRLFARLRQPFGALLLVALSHDEYKRIASDRPIIVQLKEVSPHYLTQKIRTLDIL